MAKRKQFSSPLLLLCLLIASTVGAKPATVHAQDDTIFLPIVATGATDDAPDDPASEQIVARVYFDYADDLAYLTEHFDVWEEAISQQDYVTVHVTEAELATITAEGYEVELDQALTASLAGPAPHFGHAHMDEQNAFAADLDAIPGYACYRTVEETYTSLSQLAANHPSLATWSDIGDSWDKGNSGGPTGYDINVLKLTNSAIPGPKPDLMIISAIHAREYTTAELATRFAEYLVTNYGIDPDITWLLDYNEIHIIPQANPDGRKFAEGGQLWRKNTNPTNGCSTSSYGVDLNRNSSFQWGGSGSSSNSCSATYRGPSPVSEPEVAIIQSYASDVFTDQRGPNISDPAPANTEGVFITIHSYSELVLYPWGWTNNPAPNNDQLATLGRKFGYFNGYEVCNDCLYVADGVTDDFTYGEFGVASYTFELGTSFFQDCASFESQIYPDNLSALIYAAKAARLPYQTPSGPDAINPTFVEPIVAAGDLAILNVTIDDTRSNSNGQGVEPTQAIQAAQYSIGAPSWTGAPVTTMSAADGTFNSTIESVTASIDTTGWTDGIYMIFVEGQDAAGNWGPPTAINIEVGTPPTTLFFDNFENDQEWITNPNGTDTATTGQWERGNPEETNSNGPKQLGTTVSGSNDLVTARLAGSSVGVNDIDGGETSVRSPAIVLPTSGDTTLSFSYYLAHTSNSSADDYLRVKVVGTTTQTVFEELGASNDDDGAWASFSTDLSAFAGETIYLLVEAADAAGGSIVEAALDDVRITSTGTPSNQPPVANAGPDQSVTDSDNSGAEAVTLNGSNSSDSDGSIVTYDWSAPGISIADDEITSASFPVGVHTVTLTVIDGEGATDSDTAVITVNAPVPNQPPVADAGPDQTVTDSDNSGAETVTLDASASSDSDGSIVSYAWSAPDVTIPPGETTSSSFPVGSYTVLLTVTDDDGATATDSVNVNVEAPSTSSESIYVSSTSGGTVGGIAFADEDLMVQSDAMWQKFLDMSDVSGGTEINAFTLLSDGSVLVSYAAATTIGGIAADDSDILRFIPSATGSSTAGTFEMYFDGSTAGLTTNGEDIDAVTLLANGDLILSTIGSHTVPGVSGRDEDLLRYSNGSWSLYFDGGDIGLGSSTEDIYGVWVDEGTGAIYFTTRGATTAGSISGDGADVFVCVPTSLGSNTSCATLSIYWDGSTQGYGGEAMDALAIEQ